MSGLPEEAFHKLVQFISTNPILSFPDWSLPFELCTDASHKGTGAILYQRDMSLPRKKQLRVVGFYSHSFTPAEINYNVTEKECLAVKLAVEYFRSYLEGRRFTVHTDHLALTSLMTMKEPKGRLSRWQVSLMPYEMTINHRKGTELTDADAVSRLCLENKPLELVNSVFALHTEQRLILKRYHDDPDSGGHDGYLRTYHKISSRFFWKGMKQDILDYIKNCHDCQVSKFKFRPKFDYMALAPHADVPYNTVHLDYGEIKKKSLGTGKTRAFILLIDECTRMTHTKAINEKSSTLIQWMSKLPFLSSIKKIVSDNGPSFTSSEFKEWTAKQGITQYFAAPYHPESNGLAERKIRDIKQFFSLYPQYKQGWKKCLDDATSHQNRSYNSSIGCSPICKLTGEPATFPADKEFNLTKESLRKREQPMDTEKVKAKRVRFQETFNSKHKSKIPDIKPGDEILFQSGSSGRERKIEGPVKVEEIVKKDSIPKTMIYKDGTGKLKAVALKNALPYTRRSSSSASLLPITVIALSMIVIPSSSSVFSKDSPIIWTKSAIPVIERKMHVNHTLVFNSLCQPFIDRKSLDMELIFWCNKKAETVLQPFEKICTLVKTNSTNSVTAITRGKRFIETALAVTVMTVLGVITTSLVYFKAGAQSRNMQQEMSLIKVKNMKIHDTMIALIEAHKNLSLRINQLEDNLNQFTAEYPHLTTQIAETAARFETWTNVNKKIRRGWKNNYLPVELFDLLEHQNQDGKQEQLPSNAIVNQGVPMSCLLDKRTLTVTLRYMIPLERQDAKLFEVNPFRLQMNFTDKETNKTTTCIMKYVGPQFAMSSQKCVHILDSTSNVLGRNSFIYDDNIPCFNESEARTRTWIKDETSCLPVEDTKRFPAQVITNTAGLFIYCFGQQIQMKDHFFDCPNFVFRLPVEENFMVGKYMYSHDIKAIDESQYSMVDHLKINAAVYPRIHEDPMLGQLEKLEQELKQDPEDLIQIYLLNPNIYHVFGFVVMLLFLCFCIYYWKCRPRLPTSRKRQNVCNTIIELESPEVHGFVEPEN